jgi:Putative DNA-binding domain
MFAPFESSFAKALLDVEQPIPLGINAPGAAVPTRRFAVHRNNMVAGLVKVLRGRFPVVEKIVGDEFFGAMAHAFVVEHPPRSPLLASYGDDFAGFITGFAPACQLAYLADVARIEAARTRAYRAADVSPVDPGRFAALDAGTVGAIRVEMHPSVEIIRSPHPIVTIWAMNSGERTLAPIEHWCREDALVARPYLDVEIRSLPPGGAAFLLALASGRPLGEAAQDAFADAPGFDLAANVTGLIGWGVVKRICVSELTGDGSP